MAVILKIGDGETFLINDTPCYKGYVAITRGASGVHYNFTHTADGSVMYAAVFFADILNGDDSDNPFADIPTLEEWIERYTFSLIPVARPFKLVSAASTNDTLIKAGRALLHRVNVVNASASTVYVKLYDIAEEPDETDTPVAVFPVVPKSEDTPFELISFPLAFTYGLGLRVTGAIGDGDGTATAANEVTLNVMYQ